MSKAPGPVLSLRGKALGEHLILAQLFRPHLRWLRKAADVFPAEWGLFPPGAPRGRLVQVQRLRVPPAQMVQQCGNAVLYHPRFWEEVHNLAQLVADPFSIKQMGEPPPGVIGIDEEKNEAGAARARAALKDLFRLLARSDSRRARRYHDLRTLDAFNDLRIRGFPEKRAVSRLAREENSTVPAIRSRIRRARNQRGDRKLPFKKRSLRSRA